jgi:pSer/pThr/pTyr-binding forkhead associated (FHA) protein
VVSDAFVSRRHCAILVHHSSVCELYDTASKNGTYLNGNKINGPTRLHTGDEIRMCDRNYIFVNKHDDVAPAAITHTQHD